VLNLTLAVRPFVLFAAVYCSQLLACSDSLVCGEELTPRFYWDTL
jgi:hypothetical protein